MKKNSSYKSTEVDGVEVYYSSDWIWEIENKTHFQWYWNQAKLVYERCNKNQQLLEIGVGTCLLYDLLKRRKWNIKTLDIDPEKAPDYCQNAAEFDFKKSKADVILAFEVFEHMPFSTFQKVIGKIRASKVEDIYFSVPWNEKTIFQLNLKLPKLPEINFGVNISNRRITEPTHFWELSKRNKTNKEKQWVSLQKITHVFHEEGFLLNRLNRIGYIQYFQATRVKLG